MGLFFAPIANVVLSAVPREDEGKASGANNTIRELGGVFGVAVLGAIFSANGSYASPQTYVAGLIPASVRRSGRPLRGGRAGRWPCPRRWRRFSLRNRPPRNRSGTRSSWPLSPRLTPEPVRDYAGTG